MRRRRTVLLLLAQVFSVGWTHAQWQANGVAVCDTTPNRVIFTFPRIAPDGLGGAYICWRDVRNGDLDVYAQRVDSGGRIQWQHNGIPVAQVSGSQDFPRIASDNQGNAFVAWEDGRSANTFPYVQKVNRDGQVLWQANGVKAAETPGIFISLAADERGGCVLAWTDVYNVFVQRLDNMGQRLWGTNGVQVTNRPEAVSSNDVAIVSDMVGGAICAWSEGERIYSQRIDSTGNIRWLLNGTLLSDAMKTAGAVASSSDMKGGAIISWNYSDETGGVQRVSANGQILWGTFGVSLVASSTGGARRNNPDGKSGAFIGKGMRIHHLDSLGTKPWGESGTSYITVVGSVNSSQTHDGHQGIFNFSEFFKDGEGWFVLAQWIDSTGTPRFGPDGKKMTPGIANGRQFNPVSISDGRGAAIVCWNDNRSNTSAVYVARIDTAGIITNVPLKESSTPSSPALQQNYPNPFNPQTTIEYEVPRRGMVQLIIYDALGREIIRLVEEEQAAGSYKVIWDGKDSRGKRSSSGLYYYQLLIDKSLRITKKSILLK